MTGRDSRPSPEGFVKTTVDGNIGVLEIQHPPVNAISSAVGVELHDALERLESTNVRVVIVTGGDQKFSGGFDINELKAADPSDAIVRNRNIYRVYRKFEEVRFPVIACINGYAIGGSCELALACDLRVASSDAYFRWPEIDLAGFAHMQRLVRAIGYGPARRLVYTGDKCSATLAHQLGLVDVLTEPGRALDESLALAESIARKPPLVIEACKQAMSMGPEVPLLTAQLAELALAGEIAGSADRQSRLSEFGHSQQPRFDG